MTATGQLASHRSDLATATGAAYAWAGQADDARRTLRLAVDKAAGEQFPTAHLLALVYLAIVELDDGPRAGAAAAASVAVEAAREFGLSAYHGVAPAYAVRARTGDDPALARADALHALSLARRSSTDLALGFVLTACGDTLADLGDPAGVPLLAEARSVIDRCPDPGIAGRYLARAEARHHVAGERGPGVATLVEQLTDRELAVLRHLPTPMSQRDIASELYVSLNTVKTHCRAVYRKLGVGDRKAAVQAARDLGLL
jgi:LuxR family maltose regulon positive regulatory protein